MRTDTFVARIDTYTDAQARRAYRGVARLLRITIAPGTLDADGCRRELKRTLSAILSHAWKRRSAKVRPTTKARSVA